MRRKAQASHWAVVRTQVRREAYANANIRNQGYQTYLPQVWDARNMRREPLFQSYLFVLLHRGCAFLRGTRGVVAVLMAGDKPAVVQHDVINEIKLRENANGVVVLPALEVGSAVQINSGLFANRTGVYQGMHSSQRANVLLELLGRSVITNIPVNALSYA